jgi:hypothetical protein
MRTVISIVDHSRTWLASADVRVRGSQFRPGTGAVGGVADEDDARGVGYLATQASFDEPP